MITCKRSEDEGNQLKNQTNKYLNKKITESKSKFLFYFYFLLKLFASLSQTLQILFRYSQNACQQNSTYFEIWIFFQLKKKKLEQRSKLENLEDLEVIIQLKKKKKYRKTKVPVVKEPEPEIIVRATWFCGITRPVWMLQGNKYLGGRD